MINYFDIAVLLFLKDFKEKGNDRYFIFDNNALNEVEIPDILNLKKIIICHDYWLIAPSIYQSAGTLPNNVVDVIELKKLNIGKKLTSNGEIIKISTLLKPYYTDKKDLNNYLNQFYKKLDFDLNSYLLFSHHITELWSDLVHEAVENDEWQRFTNIEIDVFNILMKSCCKGIKVNKEVISDHKKNIKFKFFRKLKNFGTKFNLQFEIPNDLQINEILTLKGYDTSSANIDYFLKFIPMDDNFGTDVLDLKKTNKTKISFDQIPSYKSRVRPIPETHGSVTSRIYYKSPSIQNISKNYRNIFIADDGYSLAYIDYDQFEIGIMAALSGDHFLKEIYEGKDIYSEFSHLVFGTTEKRSLSKILFLAFTYGMSFENLSKSVEKNNGNVIAALDYYNSFNTLIEWKKSIADKFENTNQVSTIFGNYLRRSNEGKLTYKEMRSAVSQVVQGTGSYIFKTALKRISDIEFIDILIPMHDAVLIQHTPKIKNEDLLSIFTTTMDQCLLNKISSKASIQNFFEP